MCQVLLTTIILVLFFSVSNPQPQPESNTGPYEPISFMPTDEVINYWGYKGETHYVTTEDGYILGVHRIANPNSKYPPVLLQHGLLVASDLWVLRGPKHDLALMLADMGYDVWMNNARGTTYSRNHTSMSAKNKTFWEFSWHEMGKYDLPAVIDYILEKTKEPKLFYIGHSMGTTMYYVMASARPEYNEKILVHFSLAPVCFMGRMKSNKVMMPLAKNVALLKTMSQDTGVVEIFPRTREFSEVLYNFTKTPSFRVMFYNALFEITGTDWNLLNQTAMPVFFSHLPSGCSFQVLQAYAQTVVLKDQFRQFSYGPKENLIRYGTREAPAYNLSAITSPMVLHYSYNDYFSNVADVKKLAAILPNVIRMFPIKYKKFNHVDYIWGMNGKQHFYDDIFSVLKVYSKYSSSKKPLKSSYPSSSETKKVPRYS